MTQFSLIDYLKSDLERYYHYYGKPGTMPRKRELWRCFLIPRNLPVALYRISQIVGRGRWPKLAKPITWLNFYLHNIEIAADCQIGPHFFMPHVAGTVIGARRIGAYAVIYHQVTLGAKEIEPQYMQRPEVGDRVFIASGAKVIGTLTIGDDCVIGANAVVTKSAPGGSLLTGIPARVSMRKNQTTNGD